MKRAKEDLKQGAGDPNPSLPQDSSKVPTQRYAAKVGEIQSNAPTRSLPAHGAR